MQKGVVMNTSYNESPMAEDLARIHRIITNSLEALKMHTSAASAGRLADDSYRRGLVDYLVAMSTFIHGHHLNEDESFFPAMKDGIPDAPYEALGLHHEIGSLEPGKKADIIILNWRQPHLTPTYNYYSHLVYAATGHDVQAVIVDGKVVMRDRQIMTAHENEALDAVEEIGKEIKKGMALPQ